MTTTDPYDFVWEVTVYAKPGLFTPTQDWTFYTNGPVQPKFVHHGDQIALKLERYVGDFEEVVGLFAPGTFVGFWQEQTTIRVDQRPDTHEVVDAEDEDEVESEEQDEDEFTEPGSF